MHAIDTTKRMENPIFDGVHRAPPDKTAALVFAGGVKYHNPKAVVNPHWEVCPRVKRSLPGQLHLGGVKFGRFTVIGLLDVPQSGTAAKWVVRCACGDFETRSARAIRNEANFGDRCAKCRQLAYERKSYEFKMTGRELDQRLL